MRKYLSSILYLFIFIYLPVFASPSPLPILGTDQLMVEPDMGREPLLTAINQAQKEIDLQIYSITDNNLINALINASKRGVRVNILMQRHPYKARHLNDKALNLFTQAGIIIHRANPQFNVMHQKSMVVDQHVAFIMTLNLNYLAFKNQRNFIVRTTDPDVISEMQRVFLADMQRSSVKVVNPRLVWSPDNSRYRLENLIASAKQSIDMYALELNDYKLCGLLAKSARAGIKVEIIMPQQSVYKYSRSLNYLKKAGVLVLSSPQYYIHGKAILVDDNTANEKAYVGSINFDSASLDTNRELGIIITDKTAVELLDVTFNKDWQRASQNENSR